MNSSAGIVYLVGAGPGDPGLITVRGAECLGRADVVLYDYLVDARLLRHVADGADRICLGRHGVGRLMEQEEVNRRMIEAAQSGKTVVRLKGGDPTLFARAAEELAALRSAQVSFEIVPGVSAAIAVGSYAGIPLTHRQSASCVAFVTGQESVHKSGHTLDYQRLAAFPGTLVFYMGITTAPVWSRALVEGGLPADTPAAIIRYCSSAEQEVWRCTLSKVADVIHQEQIRPPSLIIVGAVAATTEYNWFCERPLFGRTILVTRPLLQAAGMEKALSELGARVLLHPAIAIEPPPDWQRVDRALSNVDSYDWLVFSSVNGVVSFLDRLLHTGRDLRALGNTKVAAIGSATAAALLERGIRAESVPIEFRAESLADSLKKDAASRKFLLVRASRGREVLAQTLAAVGGIVEEVVVYQSQDVRDCDPAVQQELTATRIDWVTVTSSAIATSLVRMFGDSLRKTKLAAISPVTAETLEKLGFPPDVVATTYTTEGLIEAILEAGG